jgi:hypothetical protein
MVLYILTFTFLDSYWYATRMLHTIPGCRTANTSNHSKLSHTYAMIDTSRNTFLTYSVKKLINTLHWDQAAEEKVVLCVGNFHRVQRCAQYLCSCFMQPGEEFLCQENGSPDGMTTCLPKWNRES